MCTIRERANSFAAFFNWIRELSNSNIYPYGKYVGRVKELFNWIRELSNSIKERCKRISSLSNCTHIESSMIEFESSLIELESSAIQIERYLIHLRISKLIIELCNWIGELSSTISELSNSVWELSYFQFENYIFYLRVLQMHSLWCKTELSN